MLNVARTSKMGSWIILIIYTSSATILSSVQYKDKMKTATKPVALQHMVDLSLFNPCDIPLNCMSFQESGILPGRLPWTYSPVLACLL